MDSLEERVQKRLRKMHDSPASRSAAGNTMFDPCLSPDERAFITYVDNQEWPVAKLALFLTLITAVFLLFDFEGPWWAIVGGGLLVLLAVALAALELLYFPRLKQTAQAVRGIVLHRNNQPFPF